MANANDPIKRKELYDFLKQNDLVKTDFDTFSAKYAEGDTGQLHSFLKDNNLTTKSQEDFDADYFGDLKKKEDSEPIGQETEEESPIVEETQKDGSSGTQEVEPNIPVSVKEETTTPEINPTNKNPFIKEENSGVPSVENLNKSEEVEQEKTEFKRDSEKLSSINKQITEVEDKYTSLTNNPDELEAAKNSDGTLNALKNQKQQLENSVGFYNTLFEEVAKDTNSKFSQDGSFLRNLKSVVGAKEDASETVELSDGIKNQLLLDLKGNERLKQKIEQGRASLDEKEELISNAKSKHFQKEYNNLKIEKNRIVDSPSLTKDEKRRQLEGLSENFDFLLGSLGFDEATGNLKETFAKSKELQDFKEDFADDGFFNAVGDNVSTLVGGLVGVSLKAGVGFIGDSMASVGDLFTDKNNYSSFDAFQDTLDRVTDYQFAPNSEAKSKRIVNDKGNLNLNFETASKSLSEVLPFTLFLIGEAKKGKVSGIEKTLGKFINPNKSKGISSKLSMVDGAFRATYSDNLKQAKELGLENFDAMLYSSSMSMAEGVSQLIMPDTKFLNSSTGSAIINTFTKDLKSAVGKKATKQVVGNFFKNILLEVGEEEVVLAAEEIMGTALVVGHDESVLFNSTRQKELVAATVIMSGVMGTAGLRNSRTQEKLSIYKNISGNIDAIKESLNESLNVEGISEVEKTNIKSVIDYAANIDDAIKMSPENVTSEQIDFLTEKNKLVKQKENLDPAFHEGINKKINELVEKINGKSDSMSLLPEESQLKFKDQAAKEIQKEYEDKGVKDYEITDEEITKRANEIIERPDDTIDTKDETTPQAKPIETVEAKDEVLEDDLGGNNTVSESMDEDLVFVKDGKEGVLSLDGQTVVFKTGNEIIELGNKDDLKDTPLKELGVLQEKQNEIEVSDNGVTVNGKSYKNLYSDPMAAISKDDNGNYSVSLDTDNGAKRTFRGRIADEIAYQYKLKEFNENRSQQEQERADQLADEAIARREVEKTANEGKAEDTRTSEEKRIDSVKEERKQKLEEAEKTPKSKPNQISKPTDSKESTKKEAKDSEKIKKDKEAIEEIPQDVKEASEVVNAIGPSLSDATDSQRKDYKEARDLISSKGYKMEMGKVSKKTPSKETPKKEDNPKLDSPKKDTKEITQAKEILSRTNSFSQFQGMAYANARQKVIELLTGKKSSKAKSGINAMRQALVDHIDIPESAKTSKASEDAYINSWIKNETTPNSNTKSDGSVQSSTKPSVSKGKDSSTQPSPESGTSKGTTKELAKQSKEVNEILGISKNDADVLSLIYNSTLTSLEKKMLYRQWNRGVMSLRDIEKMTIIDLQKLKEGNIDKWAQIIINRTKGNKIEADDIDFEEIDNKTSAKEAKFTKERINSGKDKADDIVIGKKTLTDILLSASKNNNVVAELFDNVKRTLKSITKVSGIISEKDIVDNEVGGFENVEELIFSTRLAKQVNDNWKKEKIDEIVDDLQNSKGKSKELDDIIDLISDNRYEIYGIENASITSALKQAGINTAKEAKGEVKTVKSGRGEYDVTFNEKGVVSKIVSKSSGKEIKKFVERKVKKTKKNPQGKKIGTNGIYSKIEADATGAITESQAKQEIKAKTLKALDKFNPSDEYGHALEHMARGGKVSLTSAKKETGLSTKEVRWAVGFGDRTKLKSVEAVAEDIVADAVQDDLELDVVRQALIDIISENNSISQLEEAIVDQVDRTENDNQEQELRASLNSLSPSEFAMYEAITAEDSYISELTDEQVVEYYTEKIEEYEQGKQATERQQAREATNQKPKVVSKSVDGKKTSPELQEVDRQIEKAKNDVQKAKTTLQNKAKSLDKSINQDQEDLFGERESQNDNQLFDERVDIDKRDQATAKERQAVKDAEKSLKELQDKKKQLQETGEVTNEIDFKGQKKAKVNPEVTTLENEIDYAESNIENLNEEINNEKSNLKEETTKLREKISEVRKSKISKNSKDDKIEDLKAQIEDLKDETDGVIETYKDDIRIEKSDLKSATKKLAKLKGEGKPKSKLDSFIEGAEKLKKDIDKSGRESLGMNIPQAILSPAISIIIQTAKATKSTIKALEAGLKYIKESDWYKNLSKEDKKEVNKAKIQEMWAAEAKTPEENFEYTEFIAQRDHEALNKKPSRKQRHKNISRNIIEKYSDRQFVAKTLLKLSDMQRTADRMINGHGAAGKAKRMFDKAYEKIYADKVSVKDKSWTYLNKEDRKTLDKIIVLKRFIAIAENRAERGLSTPTNPGFISQKIAQDALDVWENKLGKEKFKDMDTRSKEYFKVYEEILSDMLDNGLISQEAFDVLNGADYQPRLFLQHIIDFDGNVDLHSKKKGNVDNGGLSQDQIKNLDEGSMQPLIRNSEWLLSTTIAGRYKAMATNTTNTKFIKKDLPKAKARYKELQEDIDNKKNWSKEDKQFFEYFTELDSKIVDNPIIGNKFDELSDEKKDRFDELQEFIDEGGILPVDAQKQYDKFMKAKRTPVHLHDKTPNGFSKAYYYENGTRGEFFIEDGLHESWFNNIKGFLSPESKSLISTYSGSSLLKNIATGVNPSFPIVNTPRDWLFTALFSSEYHKSSTIAFLQVAKDAVKAVGQIAKSKESMITKKVDPENLFNKYIEYGGDMQFLSQQGRLLEGSDVSNVINSVFGPRVRNAGGKFFSTITFQKISTYSEMMFRVAIMGRTVNNELKNLGYKDISEVEALEDKEGNVIETKQERIDDIYNRAVAEARTILDFNQGGVITKDMEAFIPYINTAVQGTRVVADAIKKDPAGTISKMLEMGISASLFIATSSLALIAFNRDPDDEEDKDLSVIEILLKTRKGISTYKKIQYFTIPTGRKDKEGEYEYWQIAKTQPMTPVFSLTDNAISTVFSKIAGVDRKDSGVAYNDIGSAINNNIMPIDISFIGALLTDKSLVDGLLSSGSGTITRNPMAKSVLSYKTQYDFYRNQSITYDIDKDDSAMSGAKDKNIEDFYKKFGRANRISPAGIKAAVESFITTPSTNPGIGFMYGGADYISASDKELKSIAGEFSKTFKKSTLKRMQGYTSPYNREINRMAPTKDETQELSRKNKWEEIDLENSVKNVMNGDISLDKFVGDLENYKPEVVKKLGNKIKSLVKYKGLDRYVIGLKFENDKEVRAKKILHFYGDINDPKFKGLDAFKQMIDMKVLDEETFKHYTRMYEEMKEKVKK